MALSVSPVTRYTSFFTPELEEILITTDQAYCDISIALDGEDTTLLNTRYYACDGRITVHGVRELIESYMLSNNALVLTVTFTFNDGSDNCGSEVPVYYCARILKPYVNPQTYVSNNCLTGFPVQLAARDTLVPLSIYTDQYTLTLTFRYAYRDAEGNVQTYDATRYFRRGIDTYAVYTIYQSYSDAVTYLKSTTVTFSEILAVSISDGTRSFTIYFTGAPTQSFLYKNRFSVWESVSIPCSTTCKTETDFATALCNELILQYDIRHEQTFEVQTPVLSRDLAEQINEMLTSRDIRLSTGTAIASMPTVIISDYTSELSNSPRATNSIKFTWQYQDRRLRQTLSDTTQLFTNQFDYPFT